MPDLFYLKVIARYLSKFSIAAIFQMPEPVRARKLSPRRRAGLMQTVKMSNYGHPYLRNVTFLRIFIPLLLFVPLIIAFSSLTNHSPCRAAAPGATVSLVEQAFNTDSAEVGNVSFELNYMDYVWPEYFGGEPLIPDCSLVCMIYFLYLIYPMFFATRVPKLRMRRNLLGGVSQYIRYWHAHMWLIRPLQSLALAREIKIEKGSAQGQVKLKAIQASGALAGQKLRFQSERIPIKFYGRNRAR